MNIHESVFIHPKSVQHGEVILGQYSSLWPFSVIRADFAPIKIGRFTNIQDNCVLHADIGTPTNIGDMVTVGHGAVLHGCTVEDNCIIGINSTVLNGSVIGSGTIVAAGAVVQERRNIPPGSFVVGVPAECRVGKSGQGDRIKQGAIAYAMIAQKYMQGKNIFNYDEVEFWDEFKKFEELLNL
ncbi:MAG: gamma carbonic anhydrase family protein [Spirochaetota bacterium]|nr:gamma carbonic anhydrase family protein [Spirochaetota bacterium]